VIDVLTGDCREILKTLPPNSFHTCVTSPPYFGLRDYNTGSWEGGDPNCPHKRLTKISKDTATGHMGMYEQGDVVGDAIYRSECPQCGAVRVDSQMGLEETPENFTSALVEVFRELHRVLRDDGTAWLNLGDSYYNYRPGRGQSLTKQTVSSTDQDLPQECSRRGNKQEGLKEKDIIGIPWRVAFALQADGWYLRQDIIWNKPNPMPESVKDRCTKSHEYIFLLTKKSHYYFDNESIKESGLDVDKNKRSVWTVPVHPYKEAHFATFPTQLIEPCIKAGSPKGGNVIDPFGGAGTTGMVADRLGRNATLIELNPDYVNIINDRIVDDAGMFAEING
jgi:DNA modification methylase